MGAAAALLCLGFKMLGVSRSTRDGYYNFTFLNRNPEAMGTDPLAEQIVEDYRSQGDDDPLVHASRMIACYKRLKTIIHDERDSAL